MYAERVFRLDKPGKDGSTQRQHFESAERQTGKPVKELDVPPLHPAVEHIWEWYIAIRNMVGGNGWGVGSVSASDILAWSRLMGLHIRPWEVQALAEVDKVYRMVAGEKEA